MKGYVHSSKKLTKNQSLVMDALESAGGSLSAYTILDQLRPQGLRAPLQIYRALEKLVELGLAHRLESLNAFVACSHSSCNSHEPIAFMICEQCGDVREISNQTLSKQLMHLAEHDNFRIKGSTIELRGLCCNC